MKSCSLLFFTLLLLHSSAISQGKKNQEYQPFSLLIIDPDSIALHESLRPWVDTVESDLREDYYEHLKRLEICGKHDQRAKWASLEMEMHDVRYFDLIPMWTCAELWHLLQDMDINEQIALDHISKSELFSYDVKKIADYYQTDYILTYMQITTPVQDGEPVLKIEAELFGRKESKIIHKSVIYARARFYTDNSGKFRACKNDLQCMLESAIMSSARDLYTFLKKKQRR